MAQLTWREVSAPNFGGVQDSLNSAARLLGGASSGLSTAFGQFGDQRTLQELAKYSDAQKLQEDVASGQFNTANASAEALGKIMSRPTNLIENATAQQNLDYRGQLNPYLIEGKKLENTSTGLSNDHAKINNPLVEAKNRQANVSTLDTYNEMVANRNAGYAATSWYDKNVQSGMLDSVEGINTLRQEIGQMDPRMQQLLLPKLAAINPDAFTPQLTTGTAPAGVVGSSVPGATSLIAGAASTGTAPSATGTAGTRNGNSYDVVLGNGAFGLPAKPVSQSTLGELGDFGRNTLIPNTRNNEKLGLAGIGKGSSAVGKYQFTQETVSRLAPKVFGKEWQTTVFTPENQDKLGEALFNETKGGNLKTIWQGLPNTTAGAYKDVPWSDMKEIISKVESPVDGPNKKTEAQVAKAGTAVAARADTVVNASQIFSGNSLAGQIYKASQSDPDGLKSEAEVVAELSTTFKDMEAKDLAKLVGETRAKLGGVAPSAVVPLLLNSAGEKGGFLGFGTSYGVDTDKLGENIKSMVGDGKTPGVAFRKLMDEQVRLQDVKTTKEELKTTNDDRKKAVQLLSNRANALPAGPRRDAAMQAAQSAFESEQADAVSAVQTAAGYGNEFSVPDAPAVPKVNELLGNADKQVKAPLRSTDGGKTWKLEVEESIRNPNVSYYQMIENPVFAALKGKSFGSAAEAERAYKEALQQAG